MHPRPALALAAMAVALTGVSLLPSGASAAPESASEARSESARRSLSAGPGTFGRSAREGALQRAREQAPEVASALGLSRAERLVPRTVERDADGTEHMRFDRTVDGLRVVGGDLVVHTAPGGRPLGADFASDDPLHRVPTADPQVGAEAATRRVAGRTRLAGGTVGSADLVVWAVSGVPRLAWETEVRGTDAAGGPVRRVEYVDAATGAHIAGWSEIQHADGSGTSLYSGKVPLTTTERSGSYRLRDATRGNGSVVDARNQVDTSSGYLVGTPFADPDNRWGSGTTSHRQSAAVDAAFGAAETWDYFQERFGRAGIRGDGVGARSRVHYGVGYDNAFWDDACFCMTYGDGGEAFKPLVSLDVAGHEMVHGVTSNTAGLLYLGESGGLNEATSDIFGTMVEFSAARTSDPGDYYIGEEVIKPAYGTSLRRMDQPARDGASHECWTATMGADDVHYTSGPANKFFYLLAEGTAAKTIGGRPHQATACDGASFTGIGRGAAAAVWWRALSVYMTSTTSYTDARDATVQAARDLYPGAPARCAAVVRTWDAVDVPEGSWTCTGRLDEGASTITPNPGFESGATAWSVGGTTRITSDPSTGVAHSGSWWADFGGRGTSGTGTLARTVSVPATATATLRFDLLVRSQDEAVREWDTFDVLVDGVPVGEAGHWSNQHAGNTYVRWAVPLGTHAGRTVTLRFRAVEDGSAATQFLLDDVTLTPR